jgi:hypothetical protein
MNLLKVNITKLLTSVIEDLCCFIWSYGLITCLNVLEQDQAIFPRQHDNRSLANRIIAQNCYQLFSICYQILPPYGSFIVLETYYWKIYYLELLRASQGTLSR